MGPDKKKVASYTAFLNLTPWYGAVDILRPILRAHRQPAVLSLRIVLFFRREENLGRDYGIVKQQGREGEEDGDFPSTANL